MGFPTKQNPLDWITQCWNIALGKKVDPEEDKWLVGPIGCINEGMEQFVSRIALQESLSIERNAPDSGLVENFENWPAPISSKIEDFYKRTTRYEFQVRSAWKPVFGSLGYLVAKLFSRRIQQLNLPRDSGTKTMAFNSQIIKLLSVDGRPDYTIWHRFVRDTGEIVFWGVYTTCKIPTGELCVKAVFPLPRGNATVIFKAINDENGNLLLISSGKNYGDPGFYFFVEDANGCMWKHYLPSFRESIRISVDDNGSLQARHMLELWRLQVYSMTYSIAERPEVISV